MIYLSFENITKSFGEKILFHNISLTISKGQKIALIAKNGTGKTTLLNLLAGLESAEGENAKVFFSKELRLGYLRQEPIFDLTASVIEAALDSNNEKIQAIKELELLTLIGDDSNIQKAITRVDDLKAWDIEARIKEILGKLNIHQLTQKIDTLSGGQKKRVALAKILIDEPDFLILDEPTNHLDLEMIEWLENYLSQQNITLFMVTHDRYFLERICNEIVELENSKFYHYRGNYSDYLEKKSMRVANDTVNLDKTKKLYRKELDWIRRQPQARGTKAKSRVSKFYEIKEEAHQTVSSDQMNIEIDMARLGGKILEAHALTKSFDELKIVESFSYKFKKGERVGIAGPNGSGKTTFIKLLTKAIKPDAGKVIIGDTVVFGHYAQDIKTLNESHRIIDAVREIAEFIPLKKGRKLTAEALLERFLFPRSQQQVYISKLSGGEKRRLHLLRVLMKNPNFLILDEPTNDLDLITINVLEEFLLDFKGCIIVTSHDRYFMDKLIDHLFVIEGNGQVKDFNGSYTEYKKSKRESQKLTEPKLKKETSSQEDPDSNIRKLSYQEKKEISRLEKEIKVHEKRIKEIEELFSDTSLSGEKISELSIELGQLQKEIAEKEDRWLELSEWM